MRPTFAINCLVPLIISFAHEIKVMLFAFAFLFFLAASLGIDFILPRMVHADVLELLQIQGD